MSLFGTPKEQETQLHLRDDWSFEFRRLDIENSSLLERNQRGEVPRAWVFPHKLRKRFDGIQKIRRGMLLVSCDRDIIFDPFGQMPDVEKPEQGEKLDKPFIQRIAEATIYDHARKARGVTVMDKVVLFVGVVMIILAVAIAIRVAI